MSKLLFGQYSIDGDKKVFHAVTEDGAEANKDYVLSRSSENFNASDGQEALDKRFQASNDMLEQIGPGKFFFIDNTYFKDNTIYIDNENFKIIIINVDETIRLLMKTEEYHCPITLIQQFLCAYETNQIIVLHGKPGTGKTSFVDAFLKAMNAIEGEVHYNEKLISVRPNWVDGQDLMGYYNPIEHRYYTTPFLEALMEANEEQERNPVNPKKYIICLDEMNLAHIEYYFADILSAMETEEKEITLMSKDEWDSAMELFDRIIEHYKTHNPATIDDEIRNNNAQKGQDNLSKLKDGKLKIPANVQFVGTLNMDATTKGLSPKVIDRSFIIEVSGETEEALPDLEEANNAADADGNRRELKARVKELIAGDNEHTAEDLEKAGVLQFSRRMEDQISKMKIRADALRIEEARFWDYVISGKVLPNVHIELSDNSELNTAADNQYPVSAKQLKDKYDPDGKILSYWLTR